MPQPDLQAAPKTTFPQPTTSAPKLIITSTALSKQTDSTNSSAVSSPTSSSLSSFAPPDAVSFSFSSPLFYDQKLYIYHSLQKLYQRVGLSIEQHPLVLLVLQYSIAFTHALIVYLLSVVISIAQLILITVTIENLEWIQTYKPLMCEWDSHFPSFVFPALDIDESEENEQHSKNALKGHKGGRYWASRETLQAADDSSYDRYQAEENQRRSKIYDSMNPTLRKRFHAYAQWIPPFWVGEESGILEERAERGQEQEDPSSEDTQNGVTGKIRRAFVRTLSGNLRPKRVTFNENVLVFGRKRASQVSQESSSDPSPMTPITSEHVFNPPVMETSKADEAQLIKNDIARTVPKFESPSSVDPEALAREEAEYQQTMASEDVNGSGTTSPVLLPDLQRTPVSPASTFSALVVTPFNTAPTDLDASEPVNGTHDLKRASTVPLKISSFLHRHHNNNASQKSAARRSATFSESSTASQNPRILPSHLSEPSSESTEPSSDTILPRSSLSLSTRARRSLSLALPKHNGNNGSGAPAESSEGESAPIDGYDSIGKKNKNLMYRIVHPQRYKRELEQQQQQERVRTLVDVQRRHILDPDNPVACGITGSNSVADTVFCGDPYYYATSTEYVEGLGAANSVISTSIGTSYPQELQSKKSRGLFKAPRPLSFDTSLIEQDHPRHRPLFKRDRKNTGVRSAPQSPTRHQHTGHHHPGHKQTQSTSSLIVPPGSHSTAAAAEAAGPTPSQASEATGCAAHRLLPRASSPRNFTSFTAMGSPANPPARPATPTLMAPSTLMTSTGKVCPSQSQNHEMAHTTFAAFGFPSPSPSPVNSAPASPRQSTYLADDTLSHPHLVNDLHGGGLRGIGNGLQESDSIHVMANLERYRQQQQQQEVLLDENAPQDQNGSILQESPESSLGESDEAGSTSDRSTSNNINSDHAKNASGETHSENDVAAGKRHRGLGFIRKLSLKKNK
ncbi:hypothetical protein BGZ58_007290 [Dissophora ornata]|nr:hypothetical protein BGZ58_007290 [Dissophora ornata]